MEIGFFGATQEVPGSCILIKHNGQQLLVDCGYYQGGPVCDERNYDDFGFDPKAIDALIVTHAHLDHVGRIPRLFHKGGSPKIYSTEPTKELARINLDDAHHIMQYESERCELELLYTEQDLDRVFDKWSTWGYRSTTEVLPGLKATLHDTGHILGSSFVVLEADGKRIAISGDVGSEINPLLHPTEALPTNLDLLICESTYGDRLHPPTASRKDQLRAHVERNYKQGGVLMIPAFSIERTQEILFELNDLVEAEGLKTGPVYLDSPLAISAIAVFQKHSFNKEMMEFDSASEGDNNIFAFPGLHVTDSVDASKRINQTPGPKVIIAGAGMMNAGRIQHHLVRYLDDANNTLLITGYQAQHTLGRRIQEGESPVQIFDYQVPVNAHVEKIESYSGHADYNKLTNWITAAKPKQIALVHGDKSAQDAFAAYLEQHGQADIKKPALGDWLSM